MENKVDFKTLAESMTKVHDALHQLEQSDVDIVLDAVLAKLGFGVREPAQKSVAAKQPRDLDQNGEIFSDPADFMHQKNPQSQTEQIACLAYFLKEQRQQANFKTLDLTKLNTEAAAPRLSNAAVAANDAVLKGYLAAAGAGRKQLTPLGRQVVECLPNRDELKTIIDRQKKPRKKRKNKDQN